MRFHLPALKGQPVTRENSSCAYTQKIVKFTKMMRARGHEVLIYGNSGRFDAPANEYVACYPDPCEWTGSWDPNEWAIANLRTAAEIKARAESEDFIGLLTGATQRLIADQVPEVMTVEYGVGYHGTFADYRVFESYAWMHMIYGAQQGSDSDGRNYDAVIPNYFDVDDFPFRADKEDYLLYMGRLIDRKGLSVVEAVAERTGLPLLFAGKPDERLPNVGEYLGEVGPEERGELMAGARALVCPTTYVEPFGGVAVEAQLCGTPVLTTDWGAFTETVRHGVAGFRCRTLGEFAWAALEGVDQLEPEVIRDQAIADYSLEAIAPQYEAYFEQVLGLRNGNDWYSDWEGISGSHRYGRRPEIRSGMAQQANLD